ncbi:hypothetical protein V6N13_054201 [Hibiscus sabdariffa]
MNDRRISSRVQIRECSGSFGCDPQPTFPRQSSIARTMQALVKGTIGYEFVNQQRDFGLQTTSQELHHISMVNPRKNNDFVNELFDLTAVCNHRFFNGHNSVVLQYSFINSPLASFAQNPSFMEFVCCLLELF